MIIFADRIDRLQTVVASCVVVLEASYEQATAAMTSYCHQDR